MSENRKPDIVNPSPRKLQDAIRNARISAAEKNDVVIDMKEADRARLELLAEALQPVFADVPAEAEQFDFMLSTGLQPRLWIDATAHVMMGRDRRTYRFVRDTRLGRIVLAESPEIEPVAEKVTAYVAERLVERERMMDGPVELLPLSANEGQPVVAPVQEKAHASKDGFWAGLLWFLIGAIAGCALLAALAWDRLENLLPGLTG